MENDGSLAEINPLVVTNDGRLLAVDAKFSIDDNAEYRQRSAFELRDSAQEDQREVTANEAGIENYVKLDGTIGCLVNGAGLAMATMDAIKFEGGAPANFLDIGTANDPETVVTALRLIAADPDVRAVLVNIFGGLARTDVIAEGIVMAKQQGLIDQPTVVRLAGTNVEEGMKILDDSGLDIGRADGFAEAARKAVAAIG
jgi:succinyl-CoA synthetase beta subunit